MKFSNLRVKFNTNFINNFQKKKKTNCVQKMRKLFNFEQKAEAIITFINSYYKNILSFFFFFNDYILL